MYKAKLWDEDKWNIHSGSYNSSKYHSPLDKKEDKQYSEQKYGAKEKNLSSDYMRKEEQKEEKEKKESFFDEEEAKKDEPLKEEDIPTKAAKEIFSEKKVEAKKEKPKKDVNSIEDAIKKAIEDEKKVIMMD